MGLPEKERRVTVQTIRSNQQPDAQDFGLVLNWVYPSRIEVPLPRHNEAVIGRGEGCEVQLRSNQVSRRHAEIGRAGRVWFVHDLDSRNGVFLNGSRVQQSTLTENDVLRIGDWVAVVHKRPPERASELLELPDGTVLWPVGEQLLRDAQSLAKTGLPLLLVGERGTGKEALARAIHHFSERRGPFVFFDARTSRRLELAAADAGTLYIENVEQLAAPQQDRLLDLLRVRQGEPRSETRVAHALVRVLAASEAPLEVAVEQGVFRNDLCDALASTTLTLPALRQRREEICSLFCELLSRHSRGWPPALEARLVERLCCHSWPLNVRELDDLVQRLVARHGRAKKLSLRQLRELLPGGETAPDTIPPSS